MPVAVARSHDVVPEPWAAGLAEHAPSTATQRASAHIHTHTQQDVKLLQSFTWIYFFSARKRIDC